MGRSAADRTYLSIREVLDLLVGEFPDVTISKIRFLESRGLIHPERTPSGYRKFYEHDVERLRWILRQQREHFLPLKVIKGRLENGPAPSLFDAVSEPFVGDPTPNGRTAVAPPLERALPAPARAGGGRAATDAPRAIAAPDAGDHPVTGDHPATGDDPVADDDPMAGDDPVASAAPAPAGEAPDPLAAGGAVAAAEPEETPTSTEASTTAEAAPPEAGATAEVSSPEPAKNTSCPPEMARSLPLPKSTRLVLPAAVTTVSLPPAAQISLLPPSMLMFQPPVAALPSTTALVPPSATNEPQADCANSVMPPVPVAMYW